MTSRMLFVDVAKVWLGEKGVPTRRTADQLGHANIRTTIDAYLGRDFQDDKSDLAELL